MERTVSLTIDELDLDAESSRRAEPDDPAPPAAPEQSRGFGLELGAIPAEVQRALRLGSRGGAYVAGVELGSQAFREGMAEGDVIVRVGRTAVSSAKEAADELGKVASGNRALLRVIREINGTAREMFMTVTKD
jgi:serine protease Do